MKALLKNLQVPNIFLFFFAIALQVQVTLFQSETYAGLRVSAADLFLPAAGLVVLISLIRRQSLWPAWRKPFGYWAPLALTGVMTFALWNGYQVQGSISSWSLLNKYTGWFILMAYLGLGGWIAMHAEKIDFKNFVRIFSACFIAVALYDIAQYFFMNIGFEMEDIDYWTPLEGLMANRNAFGFLTLCFMIFRVTFFSAPQTRFEKTLEIALWGMILVICFLNASRTLWICCLIFIPLTIFLKKEYFLKQILPGLFLGVALLCLFFTNGLWQGARILKFTGQISEYSEYNETHPEYPGDNMRLVVLEGAWNVIQKYPVLGAGLGSIIYFQEQEHGARINIIDSSAIWLLAEMGVVGLSCFLGVFICILLALRKNLQTACGPPHERLIQAALMIALFWGVFSLFHELLYTRHLWFILGMALAALPRTRPAE